MEELTLEDCNCLNVKFLRNFSFFQIFHFLCFQILVVLFSREDMQGPIRSNRIKKRQQEYKEELHKKGLIDPDNDDDVVTNLEPDILESEVKWALGSIKMKKASESDGIPAELVQILKDDTVRVLHSICQQIGKTQQWSSTGLEKVSLFSFQSQR